MKWNKHIINTRVILPDRARIGVSTHFFPQKLANQLSNVSSYFQNWQRALDYKPPCSAYIQELACSTCCILLTVAYQRCS